MPSHNDLERERYLARVKLERDELSRLASAREEGRLIGMILAYQELLSEPLAPMDQLLALSFEQMRELLQQLQDRLHR